MGIPDFQSTISDRRSTVVTGFSRPTKRCMRVILTIAASFRTSVPRFVRLVPRHFPPARALLTAAIALALTANIASTLSVYPHTLSYFNEFAGGPLNGPGHLLDANVDWGQDLLFLKRWYDAHPKARPLELAVFGTVSPNAAGIGDTSATQLNSRLKSQFPTQNEKLTIVWNALSVNELQCYRYYGERKDCSALFSRTLPFSRVGYSIQIFPEVIHDAISRR